VIGVSDYAQNKLSDVVYVELPAAGRELKAGTACVVIESVKAAEEVFAPVSGAVSSCNEKLEKNPELVNQDPFGEGWLVKVALTQGQFDALVDFCFNLGAGRLAKSTLLRCLNAGRYNDAAEQLLLWDLAGGEVNLGLKARREAELRLWKSTPQLCPVSSSQPPQIGVASSHS